MNFFQVGICLTLEKIWWGADLLVKRNFQKCTKSLTSSYVLLLEDVNDFRMMFIFAWQTHWKPSSPSLQALYCHSRSYYMSHYCQKNQTRSIPKAQALWLGLTLLRWLPIMQGILQDLIRGLDGHRQLHSYWQATDDRVKYSSWSKHSKSFMLSYYLRGLVITLQISIVTF